MPVKSTLDNEKQAMLDPLEPLIDPATGTLAKKAVTQPTSPDQIEAVKTKITPEEAKKPWTGAAASSQGTPKGMDDFQTANEQFGTGPTPRPPQDPMVTQGVSFGEPSEEAAAQLDALKARAQELNMPGLNTLIEGLGDNPNSAVLSQVEATMGAYEVDKAAAEEQASNYGDALEVVQTATGEFTANLNAIAENLVAQGQGSSALWQDAMDQADEYVTAANTRAANSMAKIDGIFDGMMEDQDFSKAHDMEVALQSSMGEVNGVGRDISERYGRGSAEYQQFKEKKWLSLQVTQSNIQVGYLKAREQTMETYMKITADSQAAANTNISYAELNKVNIMKAAAQANDAYALQSSQYRVSIEQLKMSGQENLAQWIEAQPSVAIDSLSYISLMNEFIGANRMQRFGMAMARKAAAT